MIKFIRKLINSFIRSQQKYIRDYVEDDEFEIMDWQDLHKAISAWKGCTL